MVIAAGDGDKIQLDDGSGAHFISTWLSDKADSMRTAVFVCQRSVVLSTLRFGVAISRFGSTVAYEPTKSSRYRHRTCVVPAF